MPRLSQQTHHCPRHGCPEIVDNRIFCCSADWFALSREARSGISKTATLSLLSASRRAAIEAAMAEWSAIADKESSS